MRAFRKKERCEESVMASSFVCLAFCYLYDCFATNHVCSASNANRSSLCVSNTIAILHQLAQVREAGSTVGISENNVSPSCMAHAMSDSASFSSVLFQRDDANATVRNGGGYCFDFGSRLGPCLRAVIGGPWASRSVRMCGKLMVASKGQSRVDGLVGRAVVYDKNLPAFGLITCIRLRLRKGGLQVLDSLLEHTAHPLLFIVGRHDNGDQELGLGGLEGIARSNFSTASLCLERYVVVIPTRLCFEVANRSVGQDSCVFLLRLMRWARNRSDDE